MPIATLTFTQGPATTPAITGDRDSSLEAIRNTIAANSVHWVETAYSAGSYLELRPLKVAIQDDRFLISIATGAVAGSLANGSITGLGVGALIGAYAIGAATTGPEQLPSVGNPYPSFPCTRCIQGLNVTNPVVNNVRFVESEDTLDLTYYPSADNDLVTWMWAGYQVHDFSDVARPGVFGSGGLSLNVNSLSPTITGSSPFLYGGNLGSVTNSFSFGSYLPPGAGIADFSLLARTNGGDNTKMFYLGELGNNVGYDPIGLKRPDGFAGVLRQRKVGPRATHMSLTANANGLRAIAWSYNATQSDGSTIYNTQFQ